MLKELRILNFAIIDELHLHFSQGLLVFTGETGAGKSIIIEALSLALGGRASAEMIRAGEDTATIEAAFDLTGHAVLADLARAHGIDISGEELEAWMLQNGVVAPNDAQTNVPLNRSCTDAEHEAMARGEPIKYQS